MLINYIKHFLHWFTLFPRGKYHMMAMENDGSQRCVICQMTAPKPDEFWSVLIVSIEYDEDSTSYSGVKVRDANTTVFSVMSGDAKSDYKVASEWAQSHAYMVMNSSSVDHFQTDTGIDLE